MIPRRVTEFFRLSTLTLVLADVACTGLAKPPVHTDATAAYASAQSSAGVKLEDTLRAIAASEAITELATKAGDARTLPLVLQIADSIHLERLPDGASGLLVWQADLQSVSHLHSYLLATRGDEVFRLGGFGDTDALRFAEALRGTGLGADDQAALLARLLDPFGYSSPVFSGQGVGTAADSVSIGRLNRTAAAYGNSGLIIPQGKIVRVATLSVDSGFTKEEVLVGYAFLFDRAGRLISWHRDLSRLR